MLNQNLNLERVCIGFGGYRGRNSVVNRREAATPRDFGCGACVSRLQDKETCASSLPLPFYSYSLYVTLLEFHLLVSFLTAFD